VKFFSLLTFPSLQNKKTFQETSPPKPKHHDHDLSFVGVPWGVGFFVTSKFLRRNAKKLWVVK